MLKFTRTTFVLAVASALGAHAQSYSATYLPSNAPNQTEDGQTGTNACGTGSSPTSECQNSYLNSVDDFCLFAPPEPGAGSAIGNTEMIEVAWCLQNGTGNRLIPPGTITGAHFVETPDYVQITGVGQLTNLNIPAGDGGGELDPHGASGNGNPIGGLVFSNAFGSLQQVHEWTNFISDSLFCFRACKDGPNAAALCEHIYDELGCFWNMPSNYDDGVFEECKGDSGEPMGVYGTSTFFQGDPVTPAPHAAPSSSLCTTYSTIGNGFTISGSSLLTSTTSAASSSPTKSVAASRTSSGSGSGSQASTPTSTSDSTSVIGLSSSGSLILSGLIVCMISSILTIF